LQRLLGALRNVNRYSDDDQHMREAIIKVVRAMPAPPPLPEMTFRSMVRGEAMLKMGGSYEAAAKEMEQAVLAAPWVADGYFNLGIVQEKADMFGQAIQNLRLCLLAAPESPNTAAVKAKIYELEIMQEEKAKTQGLQGTWKANSSAVAVTVEGAKLHVGSLEIVKKGRVLEGFMTISGHQEYWYNRYTHSKDYRGKPCEIPGETVPVTGIISEDGRSMEFKWMESEYDTSFYDAGGFFSDATKVHCTGVSLKGKTERHWRVER
jgi:hypothetical protein